MRDRKESPPIRKDLDGTTRSLHKDIDEWWTSIESNGIVSEYNNSIAVGTMRAAFDAAYQDRAFERRILKFRQMEDSTASAKLAEAEVSFRQTRKCDRFLDRFHPGIRIGKVLVLPRVPLSKSFPSYLYQHLECIHGRIVEATHGSITMVNDGVN